jgi:hypothetical protein
MSPPYCEILQHIARFLNPSHTPACTLLPLYSGSRRMRVSLVTHVPARVVGIPRWCMACRHRPGERPQVKQCHKGFECHEH